MVVIVLLLRYLIYHIPSLHVFVLMLQSCSAAGNASPWLQLMPILYNQIARTFDMRNIPCYPCLCGINLFLSSTYLCFSAKCYWICNLWLSRIRKCRFIQMFNDLFVIEVDYYIDLWYLYQNFSTVDVSCCKIMNVFIISICSSANQEHHVK